MLRLFRRDLGRYVGESDHAEVSVAPGSVGGLRARLEHFTYWTYDQYFRKLQRYTVQSAEAKHAAGRRASYTRMLLSPPLRFLHCYIMRLGFLDGLAGLQISALTGMSSFVKEIRLWELDHAWRSPTPRLARPSNPNDGPHEPTTECGGGPLTTIANIEALLANKNDDLRRILLVRNDRVGDLVLTMPAFEAVRRSWPQAHLTALVQPLRCAAIGRRSRSQRAAGGRSQGKTSCVGRPTEGHAIRRRTRVQYQHAKLPGRLDGSHSAARVLGV